MAKLDQEFCMGVDQAALLLLSLHSNIWVSCEPVLNQLPRPLHLFVCNSLHLSAGADKTKQETMKRLESISIQRRDFITKNQQSVFELKVDTFKKKRPSTMKRSESP